MKRVSIFLEAKIGDGPVGKVLDKKWNVIHDFEDDLEQVAHSYDVASSYVGKPGEKPALLVLSEIKNVVKKLNELHTEFQKLYDAEEKFTSQFGHPNKYADQIRSQIYKH